MIKLPIKDFLISIVLVLLAFATCFSEDFWNTFIGRFSDRDLSSWEKKQFKNETAYTFIREGGRWVLSASSSDSASGLIKKQKIDLNLTPYLNWSWQVISAPEVRDEKSKAGDDYGARVYVVFSDGPWLWNTYALNYVWNNTYPTGTSWNNAFTSHARMLALRSRADGSGVWYTERRNVRSDLEQMFGKKIDTIEAVAIMTDSDNSHSRAVANYGDIYFSGSK